MEITNAQGRPVIRSEREMRQRYDQRTRSQKRIDLAVSIITELWAYGRLGFNQAIDAVGLSHFQYDDLSKKKVWKDQSKGLFVLIHGLKGHPSVFNPQLYELEKKTEYDVLVPYLPHGGWCYIEDASEDILDVIIDYYIFHSKKEPDRKVPPPLSIMTFSLGSPISTDLEFKLRSLFPTLAIKISTIAPPHNGSKFINFMERRVGLAECCLHPVTCEELEHKSKTTHDLLERAATPLAPGTIRSRDTFLSTEDMLMGYSLSTSAPDLGDDNLEAGVVRVKHGKGHNGLVKDVADEQVKLCLDFMERHQPKQKKD